MRGPVCILGAGRSGQAAARLLFQRGHSGFVLSERLPSETDQEKLRELGFPCTTTPRPVGSAIISPGFAWDHPWLEEMRAGRTELIPEFEFGSRFLKGDLLAITGSLGKTSMAMLAAELLTVAGRKVVLSGNIGTPVCEVVLSEAEVDVHVMEVSSFQLEALQSFRPEAAVCLNLFPNHLDRHGSMENYAAAKARLFRFQEPGDVAWWPDTYPVEVKTRANRIFSADTVVPELSDTCWEQGPLRENLTALLSVLPRLAKISGEQVDATVRSFTFPPHRLQRLQIEGAGWVVDDSKSTCLSASRGALAATPGHVHLILGGKGKGESLSILEKSFADREVSLYLIGEAAPEMFEAWKDCVNVCVLAKSLDRALDEIWSRRGQGEPLLFSPGCASFDQFRSYTHRGEEFQRLVRIRAQSQPV